jgi:hypothetical protein
MHKAQYVHTNTHTHTHIHTMVEVRFRGAYKRLAPPLITVYSRIMYTYTQYTHTNTHTQTYTHICMCIYTHMYVHIHTYVCAYTHKQRFKFDFVAHTRDWHPPDHCSFWDNHEGVKVMDMKTLTLPDGTQTEQVCDIYLYVYIYLYIYIYILHTEWYVRSS